MRVFIALPVPVAVAAGLVDIGAKLAGEFTGLNPVNTGGMHLTLVFLGEQTGERVKKLAGLFEQEDFANAVIRASISGIGTFPAGGQPRVIWAGLAKGEPEVIEYQKRVASRLVAEGFPEADEGRSYHPHLTIARNKSAAINRQRLSEFRLPAAEFEINECVLFQSVLGPKGASYTELAKRRFRNGGS